MPGVRAVTPVLTAPFVEVGGIVGQLAADGQSAEEAARNPAMTMEIVTPSWFATFGVPVLRGRPITEEDRVGSPPVVVIGESAARHYWPGEDPIGKRLVQEPGAPGFTVVGVVPDTRWRDLRDPRPSVYFPLRQSSFPVAPMTTIIRTDGAPADLVPALRRVVSESEPGVAVASAVPFEAFMEEPLAQPRLNALLLALFAGAAVTLAAVGLFAVMTTMVRQRTGELGVRMALGATAGDVGRMVLRRGMAVAATGVALGMLGALAANRALAALLFEVEPTDAATLGATAAALLVVAALASLIPARASTRIEPVVALKAE
jgi:predicted permease